MMMTLINMKLANNEGQGMVEYALIIGLVAVALVAGLGLLATDVGAAFTGITDIL